MIDAITLLRAREAGLPATESHPDPPLACYPLKVDWLNAGGYAPDVKRFPEPAVPAHLASAETWPAPVKTLCGLAWGLGWSTVVTRAVGTMPHAIHGTPGQELESWAVRMVRGGQRAVAVRRGPGWSSLWTWSSDQPHTRSSTLAEFKVRMEVMGNGVGLGQDQSDDR